MTVFSQEALCALSSTADAELRGDAFDAFDAQTEAYTITKSELRRSLSHLGPRTLDAASIHDLLAIADLAGCALNSELVDCKLLALALGTDFGADKPQQRSCCRSISCCCRPRTKKSQQPDGKNNSPAPTPDVESGAPPVARQN